MLVVEEKGDARRGIKGSGRRDLTVPEKYTVKKSSCADVPFTDLLL